MSGTRSTALVLETIQGKSCTHETRIEAVWREGSQRFNERTMPDPEASDPLTNWPRSTGSVSAARRLQLDLLRVAQWLSLAHGSQRFPSAETVFKIFDRWRLNGVWERIHNTLGRRTQSRIVERTFAWLGGSPDTATITNEIPQPANP